MEINYQERNIMKKLQNTKTLSSILVIIFGNFLLALTIKLFILPANLITGGTTGIALTLHHFANVPISMFVLAFNIFMLCVGYIALGKAFALTTIVSTFAYPLSLELLNRLLGDFYLTDDLLLCTIFSGLGMGLALGIVIRSGASTGGMDIPPLILNRFFKIPVSFSLYLFDFIILLMQASFQPTEKILYAILHVMTYTIVLDKLILMGTSRTEIKIISQYSKEICDAILKDLDKGVTLLSGKGGYCQKDTQVILSVISNRDLPRIEKLMRSIDPECFMIVSRVSEVHGRGFTLKRVHKE